ncbi:hypothetical protein Rumeso_02916 [Rubellimicrobium mesophilum DSM 19309]|uniref:histidine kinase n=2 Tax=Rubellimicrobium TaxID=295418 RepID=A0A017HMP9_9RHOB|nr:hypothetical protein Rumeso_02916 [Rubellimicrobium mesophilum DSM 19309]
MAGLALGRAPGLLAALLSATAAGTLFMEPGPLLVPAGGDQALVLALFLLVTITTALAFDALFGAFEDLERRAVLLREGEARFRALVESAPKKMWVNRPDGSGDIYNAAWRDFTGQGDDHQGRAWIEAIHPDDRTIVVSAREAGIRERRAYNVEVRLRAGDGRYRRHRAQVAPLLRDGAIESWVGIATDIEDLRSAVERLREGEERLRLATEHAEVGFWDVDLVQDRLIWPPRVKAMFGISAEAEVSMADFYAGLHPDDREATTAAFLRACDPEMRGLYDVEYRTVGKEDGVVRWVAAKGRGLFDEAGQCRRVVGIAIDISPRKADEQRLREYADELETLVDAVPAAIWIARDPEARRVDGNRVARDLLRVPSPANMSKTSPDARDAVRHFRILEPDGAEIPPRDLPVQRAARGVQVRDFEETVVFEDGGAVHLIGNAVPLLSSEGRPRGSIAAFVDITALKQAESGLQAANETLERRVDERTAELREANARLARETAERLRAEADLHQVQKMETIGQLTGGVAHDFNNLLTPIMGSLDIIRRRVTLDQRTDRLLGGAMEAAERAKTLVARLLAFARRQTLETRPVDMGQLVDGMRDLIARSLGPQIALAVGIPGALPPAKVDPSQIELAILNLCVNARDAMPEGGSLRISAREELVAEGSRTDLAPGDYVVLSVADTGTGMDATTLQRAVEPFFTTKPRGRGTGLGLSMVHGLAAQSSGALLLDSQPGQGTRAEVWLPAAQEAAAGRRSEDVEAIPAPFEAKVLLVDDEDLVRLGTAEMLRDLGYVVAEANGGAAALELLRGGLAPDLLVSDYLMPGMNGADLATAVRHLRPSLPVLLITGYAQLADGAADDLPRLTKPFRQSDLAHRVADLLSPEAHGMTPGSSRSPDLGAP